MELLEAVKTRRSIRAFKTDAVPQEIIKQILEAARWSPPGGTPSPGNWWWCRALSSRS